MIEFRFEFIMGKDKQSLTLLNRPKNQVSGAYSLRGFRGQTHPPFLGTFFQFARGF